jgi:hypothetical protein
MFAIVLAVTLGLAQDSPPPTKFLVYPANDSPKQQTDTVVSGEKRTGNVLYEVFWRRGQTRRELFRVRIGTYLHQGLIKTWNYGIESEADFNGDGKPDYCWYGGDDTSESILLFTSAGDRYDRTDVVKTASAAWTRRFDKRAPDLAALDGELGIRSIVVERSEAKLTLVVTISARLSQGERQAQVFRIAEHDFKQ